VELEFEESLDLRVETGTAEMSVGEIRFLLKTSPKFFIEFFLGDELTHEVPQLHEEIFERMISSTHERNLLAIPRDHAKTTLAKLAVAWHFMFTEFRFPVYLSNTNAIALGACKDIMQYFENPNYIAVFGKIRITKASENDSLWQFDMPMGGNRIKKCILRAIGANQQMRGINIDNQRPDLAVIDDVESDENTSSPGLQAKLDRWMFGPFLKAIARNRRKILWLGNMLAKTSLLARLSKSARWNPIVFGCLIIDEITGTLKSLWPDRWSIEELIEDYREYISLGQLATWMCEMMNMPGFGANGFTQDSVYFQPQPSTDECRAAFLCLDPAFGMEAEHDNSSITVHVIREDGLPMVAEEITGKMTEAEILDNMIMLATKWGAWVWGIEAVAAQRVLISLFNLLLSQKNLIHRVTMLPLISGSGDSKTSRIRAWASLMGKKAYAIYEEAIPIVTELFAYDARKKKNVDDRIDSCSYGPIMMEQYLSIILAAAQGNLDSNETHVANEMEVCGV
jgi:hypothetical protein